MKFPAKKNSNKQQQTENLTPKSDVLTTLKQAAKAIYFFSFYAPFRAARSNRRKKLLLITPKGSFDYAQYEPSLSFQILNSLVFLSFFDFFFENSSVYYRYIKGLCTFEKAHNSILTLVLTSCIRAL